MSVKLSVVRTKTLVANTPDQLDGAISAFTQTLQEEQRVDLHFAIAPTTPVQYAVLIEYTS